MQGAVTSSWGADTGQTPGGYWFIPCWTTFPRGGDESEFSPFSVLVSHEVGMPLEQVLHVLEAGSQAVPPVPRLDISITWYFQDNCKVKKNCLKATDKLK